MKNIDKINNCFKEIFYDEIQEGNNIDENVKKLIFFNSINHYENQKSFQELHDEIQHENKKLFFSISKPIDNDGDTAFFSFLYYPEKAGTKLTTKDIKEILQSSSKAIMETEEYIDSDNIDITLYTNAASSSKSFKKEANDYAADFISKKSNINIKTEKEMFEMYENLRNKETCVDAFEFHIDKTGNVLKCPENNAIESIMVNLDSRSIQEIYKLKGINNGPLYYSNLRYYVKNKSIDSDLEDSIKNPNLFWLLNNGIVIICENYELTNNSTIKLYNFSFVNGGQTTHMIGNAEKLKEFYVSSKIIKVDKINDDTDDTVDKDKETDSIVEKVSIATNKQKPIKEKDLIANSANILELGRSMKGHNLVLISKRGQKISEVFKKYPYRKFQIDDLLQIMSSFALQLPGTTKSQKSKLWKEPLLSRIYESIEVKYLESLNIIYIRTQAILKELRADPALKNFWSIIKTGKFFIFAMIGFFIKFKDNKQQLSKILEKNKNDYKEFSLQFEEIEFPDLSHLTYEDNPKVFDENLKSLISFITKLIYINNKGKDGDDETKSEFSNVSKTDKNYLLILYEIVSSINLVHREFEYIFTSLENMIKA